MNDNLKTLPYAVTKKELVLMYLDQMSEIQIRKNINTLLIDARKKSPCNPVRTQKVWHDEFTEFIETYGLPKGY